jgi:short-subunit dehydrogenase
MSKSIAVFGAGPGLGQAVARRYAREGYTIVLVARRSEPLDLLARDLIRDGATAHVITADLSNTDPPPNWLSRFVPGSGASTRFTMHQLQAVGLFPPPT